MESLARIDANVAILTGKRLLYCGETGPGAKSLQPILCKPLSVSVFASPSISHAVLSHVVNSVGCRAIFSTHYHRLADAFASHPQVRATVPWEQVIVRQRVIMLCRWQYWTSVNLQ